MRSLAERASRGAVVLLLAACGVSGPSLSAAGTPRPTPTPVETPTRSPMPSSAEPTAEPTGAGIALPAPGRPWSGESLLGEMLGSTRPGGVPDQVETTALAQAIADLVWTVDGAAWETAAIGGFCGPTTCTLDLAGTHLGRAGEDLWVVEVVPASMQVTILSADVRSLPWDLIDTLDELARRLAAGGDLDSMALATTRWLPPPADPGRFVLSYRSGGEEGSCSRDLTLDAANGEIVEVVAAGC